MVFECLIFGYNELSFMLRITSKARQTYVWHMLSCSYIVAVRYTYCIIKGSILSFKKIFSCNAEWFKLWIWVFWRFTISQHLRPMKMYFKIYLVYIAFFMTHLIEVKALRISYRIISLSLAMRGILCTILFLS